MGDRAGAAAIVTDGPELVWMHKTAGGFRPSWRARIEGERGPANRPSVGEQKSCFGPGLAVNACGLAWPRWVRVPEHPCYEALTLDLPERATGTLSAGVRGGLA